MTSVIIGAGCTCTTSLTARGPTRGPSPTLLRHLEYGHLGNLRHRNVSRLTRQPLLDTLLRNDLCTFHDFFLASRYRRINDLLASTPLPALLGAHLSHLTDFLANLGHRNVDNLFDDPLDHL